ncbi:LysM domain-containing protein 5 (plasmid) [Achromobacter xylosoxidans]|nr:LysM domain-containing protein 5 [Achromobacter xylosoxidans]
MHAKHQDVRQRGIRKAVLAVALAAAFSGAPMVSWGQQSDALNSLMNAKASRVAPRISPVREAILRPTAQALGTQTGMIEAANEILQVINELGGSMDRTFRFGDLVMGQGVLPPVVVASHNTASLGESGKTMRVAGSVYKIEEPARFFTGAPSWRDWLLMGLLAQADLPALPDNPQLLPQDDKERAYWQDVIQKSYLQGREQARRIFEENLAGLERTYLGMRTFYELHGRGLVSLPRLATTQDVVNQTDPNTIVVGDTVFRITVPSAFNTDPGQWKPTVGTAPTPSVPAQSTNLANPAFKPYVPAQRQDAQQQGQGQQAAKADTSTGAGAVQTAPVIAPSPQSVPTPASQSWTGDQQAPAPGNDQVLRIRIGQGGAASEASSYAPRPAPAASLYTVRSTFVSDGMVFNADLPPMLAIQHPPAIADQAASRPHHVAFAAVEGVGPAGMLPSSGAASVTAGAGLTAEEAARQRAEIYAKAYADEFQRVYAAVQGEQTRVKPVDAVRKLPPAMPAPSVQAPATAEPMYLVRPGDTVYSVAAQFGVSWQSILEANQLRTPADVRPGVQLRIGAHRG